MSEFSRIDAKRVIYYTLIDISLPLGPSVNELSFVRDMQRRYGDDLTVVCPKPTMPTTLIPDGCKYIYINIHFKDKNWFQFAELRLKGCSALRKAIKLTNEKKSIIVSRLSILDLPAWLMRKKLTKFYFFVRHSGNGKYENFATKSVIHRLISLCATSMNKSILIAANGIDFLNNTQIEQFRRNLPDVKASLFVIDNGVDTDLFDPDVNKLVPVNDALSSADLVLGYFGGYPFTRGGHETVLTLREARRDGVDAYAIIVGDSGDLKKINDLVQKQGMADYCFIMGKLPYIEMPRLMNQIDVGFSILRPSERTESEQKVRQYLACDKRVVVTSGSNDFLKPYGFSLVVDSIEKSFWKEMKEKFSWCEANFRGRSCGSREYAISNLSYQRKNTERLMNWHKIINDYQS